MKAKRKSPPKARPFFENEETICGRHACLTLFKRRPDDLIKLYLQQETLDLFRGVMQFCAQNKLGYRIVEAEDLTKIARSEHHEGAVMIIKKRFAPARNKILSQMKRGECLLCLDNVVNPHNLGAIARSAAHFGVSMLVVFQKGSQGPNSLSAAAYRVGQGGWEYFPHYFEKDALGFLKELKKLGFHLVGLDARSKLPLNRAIKQILHSPKSSARTAFILGAEDKGISPALHSEIELASIPGTGAMESLNVSQAAAITLALWSMEKNEVSS